MTLPFGRRPDHGIRRTTAPGARRGPDGRRARSGRDGLARRPPRRLRRVPDRSARRSSPIAALRGLRETDPGAAARPVGPHLGRIEREAAPPRAPAAPRPAQRPRACGSRCGMLGGIAVIAVVLGATAMSGGWLGARTRQPPGPSTAVRSSQGPAVAAATPMYRPGRAMSAGSATSNDGTVAYHTAVDQVCPAGDEPDCARRREPVAPARPADVRPRPSSTRRTSMHAIVVGSDSTGGDQVFVTTQLARPTGRRRRRRPPRRRRPSTPKATPASASPTATATARRARARARRRPTRPAATPRARRRRPPDRDDDPVGPGIPSVEPTDSATPSPSLTPEPTVATALAIASGVKVVGESAAFSPDGDWFAFSARPADGSTGPDLYLWRVGDEPAPCRDDRSPHVLLVLAGVCAILASRPADGGDGRRPTSAAPTVSRSTRRRGAETALRQPGLAPERRPDRPLRRRLGRHGPHRCDRSGSPSRPTADSLARLITWPADDATAAESPIRPIARPTRPRQIGRLRQSAGTASGPLARRLGRRGRRRIRPSAGCTLVLLDRDDRRPLDRRRSEPRPDVPALRRLLDRQRPAGVGDARTARTAEGSSGPDRGLVGDGVGSIESVPARTSSSSADPRGTAVRTWARTGVLLRASACDPAGWS